MRSFLPPSVAAPSTAAAFVLAPSVGCPARRRKVAARARGRVLAACEFLSQSPAHSFPSDAICKRRPVGHAGLWFRGNFAFGWFTDLPDFRRPLCSFSPLALGLDLLRSFAFCLCGSLHLRDPGSFSLCLLGRFALDLAGGFTLRLLRRLALRAFGSLDLRFRSGFAL